MRAGDMKYVSDHTQLPLHLWVAGADHESVFVRPDDPAIRLANPTLLANPEASIFQEPPKRTCIDGKCAGGCIRRKHPISTSHAHFACLRSAATEREDQKWDR